MESKEKLNLIPAIRSIESQISKLEEEFALKIKPYKDSLEQLRKINEACEECEGRGWITRSPDEPPDYDYSFQIPYDGKHCKFCSGTGLSKYSEEYKRQIALIKENISKGSGS